MRGTRLIALALVMLAGCREKTEQERLAGRMDALRYRGYRLASEKATAAVLAAYRRQTGEEAGVQGQGAAGPRDPRQPGRPPG